MNERHFTTFNHRCDVNDARCININGDVAVADVQYYEPQVNTLNSFFEHIYTEFGVESLRYTCIWHRPV